MVVFRPVPQKKEHRAWQVRLLVGQQKGTPNRLVLSTHQQKSKLLRHRANTVPIDSEAPLNRQSRHMSQDFVAVCVIFSLINQFGHEGSLKKLRDSNLMHLYFNSLRLCIVLSVHFELSCVIDQL